MTAYMTTLRGTIQTGTLGEIFSHSLAVESSSDASTVAAAVKSSWDVVFRHATYGLQPSYSPNLVYVESTAAEILDLLDGAMSAAVHSQFSPALPGSGAGNSLPSQVALAVSLTAGNKPNGVPIKGRFYLPPMLASQLDPDGRLLTATQGKVRDMVNAHFDALIASGHIPCVWSRRYAGLTPLVNLRVGKTFDTIRRRRNRFAETYVNTPQ